MVKRLNVGDVVRLEDARGCWCLYTVSGADVVSGGTLYRHEPAWRRLPFELTRTVDEERRPILRSLQPAIGPSQAPYRPVHVPHGWQPPGIWRRPLM